GYSIGEITCPTLYDATSSSINFPRSVRYGIGVLQTSVQFRLQRMGVLHLPLFAEIKGRGA
ncbi:MAG: glycosyltransferase family 2 protein, partial [Anaerolineae bacterium]|nr:glycosyltransferase family 2 protein [Anaerolineae bacterium]